MMFVPQFYFYTGLHLAGFFPKASISDQKMIRIELKKRIKKFKFWQKNAPFNFAQIYWLLKAELANIQHRYIDAQQWYFKSIEYAQKNNFIQDLAIANECLSRSFQQQGRQELAAHFLYIAYLYYRKWGALAKITQLEQQYSQLLQPFLHDRAGLKNDDTKNTIQRIRKTTTNTLFDYTALLNSTQAISSEIQIEALLNKTILNIVEFAGAQKAALILFNETKQIWQIEAYFCKEQESIELLCGHFLNGTDRICESMVDQVIRSKDIIIVDNALTQPDFGHDTYIIKNQVCSVLVMPILYRFELKGVIYLENNLIPGAFTADRIETIRLISSQASISLENAHLYENLQEKVNQKTQDLSLVNEKLIKTNEALNQANEYKSQFLAQMTHDLRTPIHVVTGILDIIARNPVINKNDELASSLSIALQSGERLLTLVNDILDLSKIEAGKIELKFEDFKMDALISSMADQIKPLIKDKTVALIIKKEFELSKWIHADKRRIEQIIVNLVSNSAKFTTKGFIRLKVKLTAKEMIIKVTDSGVGMHQHDLMKLFSSYTMLDNKLQNEVKGTGLGLAICKGLIEAMGGQIKVLSREGRGSAFFIRIPYLEPQDFFQPTSVIDMELEKIRNKSILMCDDDEFNRIFAQMVLEGKCNYTIVESGKAALEILKNQQVDLMFLDIEMPGMNGYETLTKIKHLPTYPPVIALTAQAMKGIREKLLEHGFDDYFTKPFKEYDLLVYIYNFFEKTIKPSLANSDIVKE